jgi:hypothetical protein
MDASGSSLISRDTNDYVKPVRLTVEVISTEGA